MNARDRRTRWVWACVAAGLVAVNGSAWGQAQGPGQGGTRKVGANAAKTPQPPARTVEEEEPAPQGKVLRVPVNQNDPVAVINGETITRARLAEEAFVKKGEEVLDAMISRVLIDQAMKARKISVTAQEIDSEIDKYANNVAGVTREEWLRNLAKERKISPAQYKNDIIYPGIALKKLAQDRVQVTEQDMKDALEANFGEKLRCRMIMTIQERDAIAIWNELKKNPGGFAHIATNDPRSMDNATKINGGMLEQYLTRHAYPREVSDKAFAQLVDGDPDDKDPAHKPKDGAITGPIQVTPETWVIMKREGLVPAQKFDPKDEAVRKSMRDKIYDAKLKEAMGQVFDELVASAQVENHLTGQIKMAHEDQQPGGRMDGEVKLMSDPSAALPKKPTVKDTAGGTAARPKSVPAGVSASDRATADELKKTVSGGGTSTKK